MSPSAISRSRSPAKSHSSSNIAAEMMVPPTNVNSLSVPEPRRMASQSSLMEDQDHSTIPDPRTRAASIASSNLHPDLDQEVAALSTKLINAINHQTSLDDTLSATRQDLEASRERIKELEATVARQQETLSGDVWVKRKNVEIEKSKLLARIVEEKRLRAEVEKEKKKIEQELETLTVSLFEEANRMVITAKEDAKKEQDALHRKNEQLRAQLADTESILRSQQEQLAELKLVMGQMTIEHEDHCGTAPSSPGFSKFESGDDDTQISEGGPHSVTEQLVPTYPTNLSHLIHPVLRTDLHAYDDFMSLVQTSKRAPDSRASSGSYGLNPLLGLTSRHASAPSNSSTASLSTFEASSSNTSPQTPNTPASILSAGSTASSAPLPPLKDTKFYKRVLAEDIEPTLRLDTAPGLSWLARRSVLNAMTEGSLVVEPVPTTSPFQSISKPQFYPCALCGEARKDEPHLRNHRFRTSESDSAQRYPLCKYCLDRVRSTCDFLGFLRMVKDGHWRTEDAESERAAWEESVRLRDQMFWSRIGGGVVPVISHIHSSSVEDTSTRNSQDVNGTSTDENKAEAVQQPITPSESESTPKLAELNQDDKSEHVIVISEDQGSGSAGDLIEHLEHLELTDLDAGKSQRLSLTIPDASSKETSA
ncbi:hypothetical protein F4813DRAFT_42017 [Daldinia decipiens]|uniref:uncharacterized protein n=1 Tax=Daldinia decipiens TaxID=326647 RepID=UPI0020C3161A|nr:uncharacterized protein F4813DRAFT_42017 [Daldinia decipiens]KAI1658699.1 hypothetical protein F4813DRAFT_42017 [Daldinia decipiens]